jgi:ABC-type amino acid transport system permease subunit
MFIPIKLVSQTQKIIIKHLQFFYIKVFRNTKPLLKTFEEGNCLGIDLIFKIYFI